MPRVVKSRNRIQAALTSQSELNHLCRGLRAIHQKYPLTLMERVNLEHLWALVEDVLLDRELKEAYEITFDRCQS